MAGLSATIVAGLAFGLPAGAAPVPQSDLAVSSGSVGGRIGGSVDARVVVRNNGPDPVLAETWVLDLQAPPGTKITGGGSAVAGQCTTLGDRHVRCRYGFGLKRGERHELKLGLRIVEQPTGCGLANVAYAADVRPNNNTAVIRVTVDGKPGSNCQPPRTSPTPRSSRSASPEPTQSVEELPTELPPDQSSASESALPAYQSSSEKGSGGLSLASVLVIGGGLLLVVLGGLLIWRLLRKEPEDEYYDDETGPIYG